METLLKLCTTNAAILVCKINSIKLAQENSDYEIPEISCRICII